MGPSPLVDKESDGKVSGDLFLKIKQSNESIQVVHIGGSWLFDLFQILHNDIVQR